MEHTFDGSFEGPLFGALAVSLREASEQKAAYSIVSGTLHDGVTPDPMPMRTVLEEGNCRLRETAYPSCSDPCASGEACVAEDTCSAYPTQQNVGVITVSGLGSGAVTLAPFAPSFFYQSDELPYPPCAEGDSLGLEAQAFSAEAPCVVPLVVPTAQIPVRAGEPVDLTWEPPGDETLARVHILLDVSHHGGKRGDIVCDVPDNGSYEIPASLVNPLLEQGLAGFPWVILTRWVRNTSTLSEVYFSVSASVERSVDTGVQSCLSDEECSDGQLCDRATVMCR